MLGAFHIAPGFYGCRRAPAQFTDQRLGEEVGTTLYVSSEITDDELSGFLQQRLAKFKVPRYVHQQQTPLPRTASGKILKRDLREDACQRLGLAQ